MTKKTANFFDSFMPATGSLNLQKTYRSLEDAAFDILEPERYAELERQLAPFQAEDNACLAILKKSTRRLLQRNNISGSVQGRIKSLYSIHCKMASKGLSLQTMRDRIGLRIIVASVPECYQVLGLLHGHFRPVADSFTDYIGLPKENGYQSLHTSVYPFADLPHKIIEFQIRTELMHREAEYGKAAHWKYKEEATASGAHKPWLGAVQSQQHKPLLSGTVMELLARHNVEEHIIVFGKAGQKMSLPENATVSQALGKAGVNLSPPIWLKVNGQTVGPQHVLHDGDSLEISTATANCHEFSAPGRAPQTRPQIKQQAKPSSVHGSDDRPGAITGSNKTLSCIILQFKGQPIQ